MPIATKKWILVTRNGIDSQYDTKAKAILKSKKLKKKGIKSSILINK